MSPNSDLMSPAAATKIQQLVHAGATVVMNCLPVKSPGLSDDKKTKQIFDEILAGSIQNGGKYKVFPAVYKDSTFDKLGILKDVIVRDSTGNFANGIAWNHRTGDGFDIYFLSNQNARQQRLSVSLRSSGHVPELWDPLTGDVRAAGDWKMQNGRTILPLKLEASGSLFIVLKHPTTQIVANVNKNWPVAKPLQTLKETWYVKFDKAFAGPQEPVVFNKLSDWGQNKDGRIKYYSGKASYTQAFNWKKGKGNSSVWLDLGEVRNLADVYVNGIYCGTAWTYPYRVNIGTALKNAKNNIKIEVSNTWANRLIGDHLLPKNKQTTWTNAPYRLDGKPLLPAGLLGPVKIEELIY